MANAIDSKNVHLLYNPRVCRNIATSVISICTAWQVNQALACSNLYVLVAICVAVERVAESGLLGDVQFCSFVQRLRPLSGNDSAVCRQVESTYIIIAIR